MIRSVNVFKSVDEKFPIRIEFWDTDKLVTVYEVNSISLLLLLEIERFIVG